MALRQTASTTITLTDGHTLPLIGLGTLNSKADDLKQAIHTAIGCGYRLIDTAHKYGNEETLGEVIKECIDAGKVKRDDLIITTKLARSRMGKDNVRKSCLESLKRLQLDYVDLYLIHSPFGYKYKENDLLPRDENGKILYEHYDMTETWKEMEKLVEDGLVRSIGVSNFNLVQLDNLVRSAKIIPVEVHAYLPQYALNKYCTSRGVALSAYAPLGAPNRASIYQRNDDSVLLEESVVLKIAKKYNKTPAQILLRDIVQRGIPALPRSITPSRIKENIQVFDFELAQEDVVAIAKLNSKHRRYYDMLWMAEGHPDYPFNVAY